MPRNQATRQLEAAGPIGFVRGQLVGIGADGKVRAMEAVVPEPPLTAADIAKRGLQMANDEPEHAVEILRTALNVIAQEWHR